MADTSSNTPAVMGGGFIPLNNNNDNNNNNNNNFFSSLPSPSPSTASSRIAAGLPRPRSKPLVPGSRKEDYARDYVSQRLLHISRRFVKKHGIPDPADQVTGYETMDEVCRDLEEVIDVLWFSGTPSIQIPYLLNVALAFNTYLPSFPPSPHPTFMLLKKLDHCFASLLVGYDIRTKDPLPGFQRGLSAGLSRTEMVRCKSLADETRMLVAMVMSGEADVDNYDSDNNDDSGFVKTPVPKMKDNMTPEFIQTVGVEEIEDFDDDFDSNSDSEEGNEIKTNPERVESPPKRKIYDMTDPMDEDTIRKRIKMEEADHDKPGSYSKPRDTIQGRTVNTPSTTATNGGVSSTGQFHWALDDDGGDDDDESENETLPNTMNKETKIESGEEPQTSPLPPHPPTTRSSEIDGSRRRDASIRDQVDEEEEEARDSGSESDEELHLNVGKVYSKTLVQLGKSLGQSLMDDI
ncbi:hypothetical protein F4810DRAFT_387916 [Camillea tinctor]|nr:hypothetical protein F4810DRAFT_387916 [Camillea tinctor]